MIYSVSKGWSIENSAAVYNLRGWGKGYFGINEKGNLCFQPNRKTAGSVDIKTVVDDVVSRGIKLPVMFRFQDLLRERVVHLNRSFNAAIEEHKYSGRYFGVYPIKVNQLREVVEEILDAGEPYNMGLEAGSKSELMAVIAMNAPECLTVVNGYKDESMMRLACLGLKLGKKVIVVIEKLSELEMLLRISSEMGVVPVIGFRSRLHSEGSGKWKTSTGHSAKFGLSTSDILAAVYSLRAKGLLDCVKLLHFHIGSQVTDIKMLQDAVKEGARVYAKLRKMGVGLKYLDCGGGLGVDYEGTKTSSDYSMNYSLEEYVRDVVYSIQEICSQEEVPEPHIVTESGRSLVAYHSVLVVNVFGSIEAGSTPIMLDESDEESRVVVEMRDIIKALTPKNLAESYHDGLQRLDEGHSMFKLGFLDLEDKAKAESLFWKLCLDIRKLIPKSPGETITEDLKDMLRRLADKYLVNFSVFQSLPDAWAIDHVFPVMPLHRLGEEPTRSASLVDITCDSDGKVDQFACGKKIRETLPVHRLNGDPYHLGIFLIGAYQATMGDIHNLFGRVSEVHVFEDEEEPGGYYLEEIIPGQRVNEVLESIQYSEFELVRMVKSTIDGRVKAGEIKPREGVDLLNIYQDVMREYTYIDNNGHHPAPQSPPSVLAGEKNGSSEPVPTPAAEDKTPTQP